MRDGSTLAFAGIWESWKTPEAESLETVAILTTAANSLMAPMHDQMPVLCEDLRPKAGFFRKSLSSAVCYAFR
jgi:putative SOS response-associated peptidase YedK